MNRESKSQIFLPEEFLLPRNKAALISQLSSVFAESMASVQTQQWVSVQQLGFYYSCMRNALMVATFRIGLAGVHNLTSCCKIEEEIRTPLMGNATSCISSVTRTR